MTSLSDTATFEGERGRIRALRRMKAGATALLLLSLGVYVATYHVSDGGHGWVGFVRAASEAAMVGGLADWFAVTALFRHPLGLPIPHTALIPRRKDAIGRSLQSFVGENFLTESAIRRQLVTARIPQRVGGWLAEDKHAARVADEVSSAAAGAVRLLDDDDLKSVAGQILRKRLDAMSVGPSLGRLLEPVIRGGAHHGLVDLLVSRIHERLAESGDAVAGMIERQAPNWTPKFVDRSVARRVHAELVRIAAEVDGDPEHPLRRQLDETLLTFATNLEHDGATSVHFTSLLSGVVSSPEFIEAFSELVLSGRRLIADQLDAPAGDLQDRIASAICRFGERLQTDDSLLGRIDEGAGRAVGYVLDHFRDEITHVIADTVERWDSEETSRKIELQVGRDLQYIRVNGTVVGALAGVAIHALTYLL